MNEAAAVALERLLDEERAVILSGNFDRLQVLAPQKNDALARLPDWQLPEDRLTRLASQVNRNQTLLDASIRGIKAAQIRIESVIGAAGNLSTYDRQGQISDLGQVRNAMQLKA